MRVVFILLSAGQFDDPMVPSLLDLGVHKREGNRIVRKVFRSSEGVRVDIVCSLCGAIIVVGLEQYKYRSPLSVQDIHFIVFNLTSLCLRY